MPIATLGARGTKSLATLFSHGCGAASPHHNHEKNLFGEASPPQTPPERRLCNRHAVIISLLLVFCRSWAAPTPTIDSKGCSGRVLRPSKPPASVRPIEITIGLFLSSKATQEQPDRSSRE